MNDGHAFDLTEEPWIPCVFTGSAEPRLCSMRETLLRAHEIREIADSSPLVSMALHRFLLAVLHRALRLPDDEVWPSDINAWGVVRADGRFPADRLTAYLNTMAEERRLDLFGPRPFYQTPKEKMTTPFAKGPVTVARIAIADGASNSRPAIFDRTDRSRMTPAEAVRNLLALHAYAFGGKLHLTEGATVGNKKGLGGSQGPLTFGAIFLVQGGSLFETLMGNLVVVSDEEPIGSIEHLPAWEREPVFGYDDAYEPRGYLDLLTHQSRTVLLTAGEDDEGAWVTGVNIGPGRAIAPDQVIKASGESQDSRGRAVARLESVMMLTTDQGTPFIMSADRALWSGAHVLFGVEGDKARRSPLGNVAHLSWANHLRLTGTPDGIVEVLCTGIVLKAGGGSIGNWHTERLPIILPDDDMETRRDARRVIASAITEAERVAEALRSTSLTFARAVIDSRTGPAVAAVDAAGGQSDYWMTLQREFPAVVQRAAAKQDAALSAAWSRLAVSTASASLERLLGQLAGDDRRWMKDEHFRTASHARVSARQELIERIGRTGRFAPKKSKGA